MALDKRAHTIKSLLKKIEELEVRIEVVEEKTLRKVRPIQHVEEMNGIEASEPREEKGLRMNLESKVQSMKNACAILPPNMTINGRHEMVNVEAICGFKVDEHMMDLAYEE